MKTTPSYEQYINECRQAATKSCDEQPEQHARQLVVPVMRQLLADQHTTVSLLQRFYHGQEGVFLLESVEGGEKWGRYSFLGIDAHAFVEVHQNEIRVVTRDEQGAVASERLQEHHGKPLEGLRELMAHYRVVSDAELPRFFGGLVGYFTYEMVSFFENIPHQAVNEPFASFVIPRTLLILDNVKQILTVCVLTFPQRHHEAPGELYHQAVEDIESIVAAVNSDPWSAGSDQRSAANSTLTTDHGPLTTASPSLLPVLSEREYRKRVGQIQQHIHSGDVIQCVFSQPFVADQALGYRPETGGAIPQVSSLKPIDAIALYRALRFANPAPYLFFMHLSGNVLAGSSPETMVRLEGRTATLRPIAGTRKRGHSVTGRSCLESAGVAGRSCLESAEQRDRELADELLRDPKEKAEHLMLVDLGRNDLGRIAKTGTVQVTDLMFIERHSHVMHLVSNVTAELEDCYDGFDLFRATFPAGTLTGAPKVRAMQLIAEYESTPRGPYGGAAGYIAFNGNMDFAITIRTARIRDGQLTVQAGGGIVYDSDPELERQETVNKAMGIEKALRLLSELR